MSRYKLKPAISYVLMQVLPVMLGVYLGFVVSNWGEGQKEKQQSRTLVQNLSAEIKSNQASIKAVARYHQTLRDSCQYYLQHPLAGTPAFFEGTRSIRLINSAYMSGIQRGLFQHFPLDDVQQLNQIYSLQTDYVDYGKMITGTLITLDFDEDPRHMRKILQLLAMTMTDLVIQEKQLLDLYAQMLPQLVTGRD